MFGASDDILGSIESGVDIERRIHEIYQHCRSDEQIEQEFNQLQDELKEQLENRENETRRSLFEHFDVDVVRNLKTRRTTTLAQLNVYQENLLLLAEMFLSDNSDSSTLKLVFVPRESIMTLAGLLRMKRMQNFSDLIRDTESN